MSRSCKIVELKIRTYVRRTLAMSIQVWFRSDQSNDKDLSKKYSQYEQHE